MPVTLTPDQQAKLDAFEGDAQAATVAEDANASAQVALREADANSVFCAQDAVTKHAQALASAQTFIDAMIKPTPAPDAKGVKA